MRVCGCNLLCDIPDGVSTVRDAGDDMGGANVLNILFIEPDGIMETLCIKISVFRPNAYYCSYGCRLAGIFASVKIRAVPAYRNGTG